MRSAIKKRPPSQAASFVPNRGPLGSLRFLLGLLFHDSLPTVRPLPIVKAWRRADERGVNRLWRITHGGRSLQSKRRQGGGLTLRSSRLH